MKPNIFVIVVNGEEIEQPRFVVDGHEFDDTDSNFMGDGQYPPFVIFDVAAQDNLPGQFATRAEAEAELTRFLKDLTMDIMIDLETLGTSPDSVIVQIGAVLFDPHGDGIDVEPCTFNAQLDVGLQVRENNRTISHDTVLWWFKQSEAARTAAFGDAGLSLCRALGDLNTWCEKVSIECAWGNGAGFDIAILNHAYAPFDGWSPPWKHWNERCFRTLKNIGERMGVKLVKPELAHDAVSDALAQARNVQLINAELRMRGVLKEPRK